MKPVIALIFCVLFASAASAQVQKGSADINGVWVRGGGGAGGGAGALPSCACANPIVYS